MKAREEIDGTIKITATEKHYVTLYHDGDDIRSFIAYKEMYVIDKRFVREITDVEYSEYTKQKNAAIALGNDYVPPACTSCTINK